MQGGHGGARISPAWTCQLHAHTVRACTHPQPPPPLPAQYLVFEYVEKNLLEVLEEYPGGLGLDQVRGLVCWCPRQRRVALGQGRVLLPGKQARGARHAVLSHSIGSCPTPRSPKATPTTRAVVACPALRRSGSTSTSWSRRWRGATSTTSCTGTSSQRTCSSARVGVAGPPGRAMVEAGAQAQGAGRQGACLVRALQEHIRRLGRTVVYSCVDNTLPGMAGMALAALSCLPQLCGSVCQVLCNTGTRQAGSSSVRRGGSMTTRWH